MICGLLPSKWCLGGKSKSMVFQHMVLWEGLYPKPTAQCLLYVTTLNLKGCLKKKRKEEQCNHKCKQDLTQQAFNVVHHYTAQLGLVGIFKYLEQRGLRGVKTQVLTQCVCVRTCVYPFPHLLDGLALSNLGVANHLVRRTDLYKGKLGFLCDLSC